ncbi:hypothetical protein ALC56_03903 [Trachymyrmex septentrionalis]|uniref:Uncharacterized protein n=1 Tax=Trachymyrmex septentrionalis TaxID=34720 RepID=A0A151JYZ6_9HYME|nr:hypothetical protein ALC56_03903 [Trachymyrmex septentrionalis]
MFFFLTDKRGILDFTAEQLQYIPRIVLLHEFENYVELLWDRLPEHLKTDPEVQRCRPCIEHYNRQRTHINGPPSLIKNCDISSYFPALDLSNGEYELGLTNFETYNAIPYVTFTNNKFYFDTNNKIITIPEGSYEVDS